MHVLTVTTERVQAYIEALRFLGDARCGRDDQSECNHFHGLADELAAVLAADNATRAMRSKPVGAPWGK